MNQFEVQILQDQPCAASHSAQIHLAMSFVGSSDNSAIVSPAPLFGIQLLKDLVGKRVVFLAAHGIVAVRVEQQEHLLDQRHDDHAADVSRLLGDVLLHPIDFIRLDAAVVVGVELAEAGGDAALPLALVENVVRVRVKLGGDELREKFGAGDGGRQGVARSKNRRSQKEEAFHGRKVSHGKRRKAGAPSLFLGHKLLHACAGALGDINRPIRSDGDVMTKLELARPAAETAKGVDDLPAASTSTALPRSAGFSDGEPPSMTKMWPLGPVSTPYGLPICGPFHS